MLEKSTAIFSFNSINSLGLRIMRIPEVEESITWELAFPGGVATKGESSYSQHANYLRAESENGNLSIDRAYAYGGLSGEKSEGPMDFPQPNQQTLQMDAFAGHILNGAPNRVPGEMGVRDVKILYAVYEAAETGQKVEFDWVGDVAEGKAQV